MPDRLPEHERITGELRRNRLTFDQRRKHLDRLERAIVAGEDEMDFLRRRSRTEFVVLAASVTITLVSIVLWTTVLNDSGSPDGEANQTLAMAEATLTARAVLEPATVPSAPAPASPAPHTQAAAANIGTCNADAPAKDLVPGLPFGDPSHVHWYGSREAGLWASPVDRSAYVPGVGIDASELWYAGEITYVMWYGSSSPIYVTGKQLDGDGDLGTVSPADVPNQQIQWSIFTIPEPGCWEITGSTARGESLTVTADVRPMAERPDVVFAEAYYAARPYEEPSTCPITPWIGPEARQGHNGAHYWMESEDISVDVPGWFVAGEEQILGVYGQGPMEDLSATAERLDGGSGEVLDAMTTTLASGARTARYVFPSHGCWEIELAASESTAMFVVYVYPQACEPEILDGLIVADCEPPRE